MKFWTGRTHDRSKSAAKTWLRHGLLCAAAVLALNEQPAQAQTCTSTAVTQGYRDFNFGSTVYNLPTSEKPEHKLWWNDGFWWGSLWDPSANKYRIHRFNLASQCWTSVGPDIDDRSQSLADALWDGNKLYIASHIMELTSATGNGRLYRYSYDAGTDTYSLDSGFPVDVNSDESETLTLTKDSTGKLWVTWVASSKVMVNNSTTSDATWGTPFQLPVQGANVSADDISAIVQLNNRVGILWSNQNDKKMYFASHIDGEAATSWQAREIAKEDGSKPVADDHINLKLLSDGSGNMYAVTKSSTDVSSETIVYLLKRDNSGNWSSYEVSKKSDNHTRPILALDSENRMIYVFLARLSGTPRTIYRKSTSMDNIQFAAGLGDEFIKSSSDAATNNPTSTRQNVNSSTGILVLASDEETRYYLHGYMSLQSGSGNQPPVANATGTPQSGTAPLQVSFSSSGSNDPDGSISSYSWNFGDGTSSTSANPTKTYNNAGNYTAVLTVTDNQGATGTDNVAITVNASSNQSPVAMASANPQSGEAPLLVSFSSAGSNDPDGSIASYSWNFGDGTSSTSANPTKTYNSAGNYTATLTVTDNLGATGNASLNISVALPNGAQVLTFTPLHDTQVKSSSPTSTYGSNTTFRVRTGDPIYNAYLKFDVSGISGIVVSAKLRLFVNDDGTIGGTVYAVSNDYLGTSTPWVESGLNWNNAPAISGTPLADIGVATLNTWAEVNVAAAITGNGTFSFGINSTSTSSVYYNAKEMGSNAPQLVIETVPGSGNQSPVANATATPQSGTAPLQVSFSSSGSNDPDGSIASYSWNFGDGTSSTSANPTKTYNSAGNYTAVLTVTDNQGATGTDNVAITVNAPSNQAPVANAAATPQSGTAPLQVSFSSSGSNDPDGSISSYSWNFGDGTSSTSANPTHTYNAAGNYTAVLTVTDNQGATGTANVAITVNTPSNQSPVASAAANPQSGEAPLLVSFSSAGSNDPDGSIASYSWNFGDGNSSTEANPTHTYNAAGNYTATLTVTDNLGATGNANVNISVSPAGGGQVLTFMPIHDTQANQSSPASTYGTMTTFRVRNGSPTYNSYLKFDVSGLSGTVISAKLRLYVADAGPDGGTIYSISNNYLNTSTPWVETGLHWNNAPTLSGAPLASAGTVVLNTWIELNVTAAITGNGTFSFGMSANNTNSVYYTSKEHSTDYAPKLVIETGSGSGNQSPVANASATPESGDAPLEVSFSASGSNDPDGSLASYAWNFGDGNSSTEANPTHTYNSAGNYTATLTVTDNQGATGADNVAITVNASGPQPPAAPTSLTATATSTSQINLSWSDNSGDEDGFKIERKTGANGTYAEIFTAAANATSYSNLGLTAGTNYVYRVLAFNAGGNSNYSNEASATTQGGSGNTNLALNQPATAMTSDASYPPSRANDGNTSNYWRSGSVSGSNPTNWWRVDLGSTQTVARIVVQWRDSYFAKIYDIQVSHDDVNYTTVHTNNAGTTGTQDISFAPVSGRYVRIYMRANQKSNYRIIEFQVYASGALGKDFTEAETESTIVPEEIALEQNYPNPFNPSTTIAFSLNSEARVMLRVYDMLGAKVATLVNGVRKAGRHTATFDASHLPTGSYYYVLQVGETRIVKRLSFVK